MREPAAKEVQITSLRGFTLPNHFSFRPIRPERPSAARVRIVDMRCSVCGFTPRGIEGTVCDPTGLHDNEWTHEFSWETGQRCGGRVLFSTERV